MCFENLIQHDQQQITVYIKFRIGILFVAAKEFYWIFVNFPQNASFLRESRYAVSIIDIFKVECARWV